MWDQDISYTEQLWFSPVCRPWGLEYPHFFYSSPKLRHVVCARDEQIKVSPTWTFLQAWDISAASWLFTRLYTVHQEITCDTCPPLQALLGAPCLQLSHLSSWNPPGISRLAQDTHFGGTLNSLAAHIAYTWTFLKDEISHHLGKEMGQKKGFACICEQRGNNRTEIQPWTQLLVVRLCHP